MIQIPSRWLVALFAAGVLLLPACSGNSPYVLFVVSQTQVNQGPAFGEGAKPRVCCAGNTVYMVWEDDRNNPGGNEDVYFNCSLDGGVTWLPADIRVNANPGVSDSDNPQICCFGQRIYVVWADNILGPEHPYFNYSTDGGLTWQVTDTRLDLDSGSATESNDPQICCDGLNVYVAWDEGAAAIYANASSDGGVTWFMDEVRVDIGIGIKAEGVKLCCNGTTVYAAWRAEGPGSVICASVSTNGGVTWGNESALNPLSNDVDTPEICCDGQNVYVSWDADSEQDVYLNSSLNGGASWQATEKRLNTDTIGNAKSADPTICCNGLNVYVAWEDARVGAEKIYSNRSIDGGLSWQANDIRIDDDPARANNASICCEGGTVHIAWIDERLDPADDIYYSYSNDGGLTWFANVRADNDPPGVTDPNQPQICCSPGTAYVVWHLDNPTSNIYLSRAIP